MQDSAGVREGYRVAHAQEQAQTVGHRVDRLNVFVETLAFDEFHGVEDATVLQRADVVYRDDSRVFETCEDLGFAHKAAGELAAALRRVQHLQGDAAAQRLVLRGIDHAHAAAGYGLEERITRPGKVR